MIALVRLIWRADRRSCLVLAVFTAVLGIVPSVIVLATGWFTGSVDQAVRDGLGTAAGHEALWALGSVGALFALNGTLLAMGRWLVEVANTAFARQFALELGTAHLAPRYLDSIEAPETADELETLRQFETSGVYMQAIPALRMITSRRIGGISAAAILFGLSWWAPLVMVAGWRTARWGSSRWLQRGFAASRDEGAHALRRAQYLRTFATDIHTAKEVRLFGLGQWLLQGYIQTWHDAMRRVWAARRSSSRDLSLGIGVLLAAHVTVFGWLGWQAHQGHEGLGRSVALGMAVLATADLGFLGDQEWRLVRAAQLAGLLQAVTRRLGPRASSGGSPVVPKQSRSIDDRRPAGLEISAVRFAYPGSERPVLDGFNLTVEPGESVAVVGENGAGKSTLLKLLCGLYRPDHGRIMLDGVDVDRLDPQLVSSRVSVIFQEFLRYQLPLRENVGFGSLGYLNDEDRLSQAMHAAAATDLLDQLPSGLDTVLAADYPGGVDLSGGQWQRVALARALLAVHAGAGMLILDEPTASLDVRAEVQLFERFLEVTRGLTTILISHRLYGVRKADRIVVLSGGRIIEDGSHEQLMDHDGRYAEMFRLQAQRFDKEQPEGRVG